MYTISSRAIYEFTKLVDKEIEDIKQIMAAGSLTDWDQYKSLSGTIAGLRTSLELLDEAQKIANSSA